MNKVKRPSVNDFIIPGFIVDFICLIIAILLFNNDDAKGLNAYFCSFSIYSLNSLFAIISILKYSSNRNLSKLFLLSGAFYVLLSSILINEKFLNGQGVLSIIIFLDIILISLFIIAIWFHKNGKIFEICMYAILLVSLIVAVPAIALFVYMIYGFIWLLFNKRLVD